MLCVENQPFHQHLQGALKLWFSARSGTESRLREGSWKPAVSKPSLKRRQMIGTKNIF